MKAGFDTAVRIIENAANAHALFGNEEPEKKYRMLALLCHPDQLQTQPESIRTRGEAAFRKLSMLYAQINGKTAVPAPVVLGKWVVGNLIIPGDITDIYHASSKEHAHSVLKIARSPADTDLMEQEVAALKKLHADTRSEKFKHYVPAVQDTFKASGRRAVVMQFAEAELRKGGFEPLITLENITATTGKLPMRHVVWMSNRLLSALGFVHNNGVVHGAIIPSHLMYGPLSHTLLVVDWCYSVDAAKLKHIPAIVEKYKSWYPREVLRKNKPSPSTDLYMWAMMVRNTAESIPPRMKGLLDWCLTDSMKTRPENAWDVQDKWRKLAKEEFGPPSYTELKMTTT